VVAHLCLVFSLWIALAATSARALIAVGTPAGVLADASDVAVANGRAYVAGSLRLQIFDASNPETGYTKLGELAGSFSHVEARGDVAFLTSPFGLHVVDASDPANPHELAMFPVGGIRNVLDLELAGPLALLAEDEGVTHVGLRIVDVSNPAAPVARGQLLGIELPITPIDFPVRSQLSIVRDGHFAYLAESLGGVAVVDVSNPDAPALVTTFSFAGGGPSGAVGVWRGSLLLPGDDLLIYDVTNPAAPAQVASLENVLCERLQVVRGIGYCAEPLPFSLNSFVFQLFDVSDARNPAALGVLLLDGFANGIAVSGEFAHVATVSTFDDLSESLRAIDVRVPEFPARRLTDAGAYLALAHAGDRLYAAGMNRFDVLDVTTPLDPVVIGSTGLPNALDRDIEVFGTTAYVTSPTRGLQILDVSDPANPRVVGEIAKPPQESATEIARAGTHLYVGTFSGVIEVYDLSVPTAPVRLGSLPLVARESPHDLDIVANRLYVTSSTGISIVDVADASAPREIGRIESPVPPPNPGFGEAAVAGHVLYVNEPPVPLTLAAFDVSDPAHPRRLGAPIAPSDYDLEVTPEGRLFLGADRVYDIADPSRPVLLGRLPTHPSSEIEISGTVVYAIPGPFTEPLAVTDFGPEYAPTLDAAIDVKPGDPFNRLSITKPLPLLVGLLGSPSLDVRNVDRRSLALGPGGAPALLSVPIFVNRDRRLDLLSLFSLSDAGVAFGDTQLCLSGRLTNGRRLRGCDAIQTWAGACGRGYEVALIVPLAVPLARAARRRRTRD